MEEANLPRADSAQDLTCECGFTGSGSPTHAYDEYRLLHNEWPVVAKERSLRPRDPRDVLKNLYPVRLIWRGYKAPLEEFGMNYHVVTLFHLPSHEDVSHLGENAVRQFGCLGVEEYSMVESEVDALLGDRSYSGGDLPFEVLGEVDDAMKARAAHVRFYFAHDGLESAQKFLTSLQSTLCEASIETRPEEDWNVEWKKHYSPIPVGDRLMVLPAWIKTENDNRRVVRINPGMGFGTGSHQTTYLCLKAYLEIVDLPVVGRVLDYGSGSGILALGVLVERPEWNADLVDIDPVAHDNARENLTLNDVASERARLLLVEERDSLDQVYPLVFANILQNILHQERDYLIERTGRGGYLILSGLLSSQLPITRDLYQQSENLELVKEEVLGDWGVLMWRRKS